MPNAAPTGKHRIWYVVCPAHDRWQVTFGCDGSPFCYTSRDEALVVACSAAKLHHQNRGDPTGALLELPGEPRHVLATYGRLPHLVRTRANAAG
jgi:hypothetical protein